jgi:hypothetical protein
MWLAKDQSDSPQPYQQLAAVLHQMGADDDADNVLYTRRDNYDRHADRADWWTRGSLVFLKYTIGYGIGTGYFRVLWWVALFMFIGTFVLWSGRNAQSTERTGRRKVEHSPLNDQAAGHNQTGLGGCAWQRLDEILLSLS